MKKTVVLLLAVVFIGGLAFYMGRQSTQTAEQTTPVNQEEPAPTPEPVTQPTNLAAVEADPTAEDIYNRYTEAERHAVYEQVFCEIQGVQDQLHIYDSINDFRRVVWEQEESANKLFPLLNEQKLVKERHDKDYLAWREDYLAHLDDEIATLENAETLPPEENPLLTYDEHEDAYYEPMNPSTEAIYQESTDIDIPPETDIIDGNSGWGSTTAEDLREGDYGGNADILDTGHITLIG